MSAVRTEPVAGNAVLSDVEIATKDILRFLVCGSVDDGKST